MLAYNSFIFCIFQMESLIQYTNVEFMPIAKDESHLREFENESVKIKLFFKKYTDAIIVRNYMNKIECHFTLEMFFKLRLYVTLFTLSFKRVYF